MKLKYHPSHKQKKIFWQWNYPVAILLFVLTALHVLPDMVMLFYTLICSVYANVETSHGAEEAEQAKDNSSSS